ncbi:MAG: putative glycoside hydrolase [Actinomycetota bacterium]
MPLLLVVAAAGIIVALVRRDSGARPGNTPAATSAGSPARPSASATTLPASTGVSSPAPTASAGTPTTRFSGPRDGDVVSKTALQVLSFEFSGVAPETVHGSLDGIPITFTSAEGAASNHPGALTDGEHHFECYVDGAAGDFHVTRTFTVDTAPPIFAVTPPPPAGKGKPLTVVGTIDKGSTVTANGKSAEVTQGSWKAQFATAPAAVHVVASDPAGNTSSKEIAVHFPVPLTRAVHMTARAWGFKVKREAALALLRAHKINAIEVDIKDEDGLVGYETKVPLAKTVGAVQAHYDTKKMIAQIHQAGGRVIGRLVAFRDPALTKWAWTTGQKDMVLQKTDGTPFTGSYGDFAFPNFSHPTVQKYNVDLAVEAATLGFDDVLYDYLRRPDGKLAGMRIPGLQGTTEQSIAGVVAATKAGFAAAGVTTYLGASVFGIAATRPREIAQDIGQMAPFLDYVAPMVYPSHWAPGEYKVADPNKQPYEIVQRSLKDFQTKVRGSNAAVIPWLQDFSLYGVHYGPDQLHAQFKAAADDGVQSFLLWNAEANYTGDALSVMKSVKYQK